MTHTTDLTPEQSRRLRRIAESWRAESVRPEDLARARVRIRAQSRPERGWLPLARQFFLAAVATAALVLAIEHLGGAGPSRPRPSTPAIAATPAPTSGDRSQPESTRTIRAEAPYVRTGAGRVALIPGLRVPLAANETASIFLPTGTTTVRGPTLLEFHIDSEAASGWRMERLAPQAPVGLSRRRESPRPESGAHEEILLGRTPEGAPPNDASAWQRAARALEAQRVAEADVALDELTNSHDRETRDAAWLARAELWLSGGDRDRARPILLGLAERGATPIVRRRAADLLAQ